VLFARGKVTGGRRLLLGAVGQPLAANPGPELVAQRPADRAAQEDSVRVAWTGRAGATAAFVGEPVDLSREANGDVALVVDLRVDTGPTAPVTLNGVAVTDRLRALAGRWGKVAVPLRCLKDTAHVAQPFAITTAGRLDVTISAVRFGTASEGLVDCRLTERSPPLPRLPPRGDRSWKTRACGRSSRACGTPTRNIIRSGWTRRS
jgi:beta-glucosidase